MTMSLFCDCAGVMPYSPPGTSGAGDIQAKETVHVYIPNAAVGAIIGTGGSAIREMISSSGATIKVRQVLCTIFLVLNRQLTSVSSDVQ